MAKTYGELILEYENYEYSKENYEITKECYEIELMEKYLESQEFLKDNIRDIRKDYQGFNESYFIEASDEETKSRVTEEKSGKERGLLLRLWDKLVSIFKAIGNFFKNILRRFGKLNRKVEEWGDKYNAWRIEVNRDPNKYHVTGNNNEEIIQLNLDDVIKVVEACWPQSYRDKGFDIATQDFKGGQVESKNMAKLINSIDGKHLDTKNKLFAAFTTKEMKIKLIADSNGKVPLIADSYDFANLSKKLSSLNPDTMDEKGLMAIIRDANKLIKLNRGRAVVKINVDEEQLRNDYDALVAISNTVSIIKGILASDNVPDSKELNFVGVRVLKILKELVDDVTALAASQMNLYNIILTFRNNMCVEMSRLLRYAAQGNESTEA